VREIVAFVAPELRKKQARLVFSLPPDVPAVVADADGLSQVLLNLIKNAVQVMSDKGDSLAGRSPRIVLRLRHEKADDLMVFEVEDNGPGMNEETRTRVFEPFFTTKPPGEGTGLGLAVSYFIVTVAHRGSMSVESTPGIGTKIIVKLPVKG